MASLRVLVRTADKLHPPHRLLAPICTQIIVREGMPLSSVYFINRGIVQYSRNEVVEGVISNNENFGLEDYDTAQVSLSTQ